MKPEDIIKLLKTRSELISRLSFYNNPPMFNIRNYESYKKRILKRLHKISDILHKELNVDKAYYRF